MALITDFKLGQADNRGVYYEETERCLIFISMHETIEDVYKTITHEVIHHCLGEKCGVQPSLNETLDEAQEEAIIFNMQWADMAL